MDLAGILPRFISLRRGAILVGVVGILIQPWRLLTQAATFITVLSSFGGKSYSGPFAYFSNAPYSIHCTDDWYPRNRLLDPAKAGLENSRPVQTRRNILVQLWIELESFLGILRMRRACFT
jgi:Permease for cytosine/purines, uracil, thiamine, allantoin